MSRKRVLKSPGTAWVVAALGAWAAAASCRTAGGTGAVQAPPPPVPVVHLPTVPEPSLRVGIAVDVPRVSIGADSGVVVHATGAEGKHPPRTLPRATFLPGATAGRLRLVETGEEVLTATLAPVATDEPLRADADPYRGLLEARAGAAGTVTVVNIVHLEDYLRGVVPNELSPQAFPEIEALKAQAVAARSYALAHLGEYAARGFDVCATQSCQVYRGRASEQPLTDRAVEETAGLVATWRGRPINAYYTSTCGGHTEDGTAIFDDAAPYLRGVACTPERTARHAIHTSAARPRELPGVPGLARQVALLASLGILPSPVPNKAELRGIPADGEVRAWTARLLAALHRRGCESPVGGSFARRGNFAVHLVASLCWQERAERLLAPGDTEYLLQAADADRLDGLGERQAMALLVHEDLLSPFDDDTLRPDAAFSRGEALALLAGATEKAGAPALRSGEFAGLGEGSLSILHDETADSHVLDPAVRLFRSLDGVHAATSDLTLSVGDTVRYVVREDRVVFLEAEQTRRGGAADRSSRYYRWEVRMTPAEVARAVSRYGSVGDVRDLVPRRLGVSGRVVELAVRGSAGELLLKGLQVRWGLGLRENLFVLARETDAGGAVERFVITGKGWGHGVGLCQVGAFGMARAGSSHEQILTHYYSGVRIERAPALAHAD